MDPASVNTFLDQFLALADNGFGLIEGDVRFVLNALIVISVTLAGVQWALAGEAPMAPFFRKVLFVGLFAFLINNWNALSTAVNQSGAMLGLRAGGDGVTLADLHNPGRVGAIGIDLFGRTVALAEGMNILTDAIAMATIWVAAFFVMLGFFVLALQLFVALIAFKLGSLVAFVALPWGVFSGTAWVAERPLGWVAGSAMRLFVLAFVASIATVFVETLPATFTLDVGGVLNVLLFGFTMLGLAWFAPMLASEVMQGQPSLSGNDAYRAGQGVAITTIVGQRLASGMIGSVTSRLGAGQGGARGGGGGRRGSRDSIDYERLRPPKSPPPEASGSA